MIFSGLLKGFDNWIAKKVTPAVSNFLAPVGERGGSIIRSVQTRSFTPLKESFQQQRREMAVQPTDTPQQRFAKVQNIALMVAGDSGLNARPKVEIKPTIKPQPTEAVQKVGSRTIRNFIQPLETVIGNMGKSGEELKKLLTTTADKGELEAAKRVSEFVKAQTGKLSREDLFNLHDVLHGKAKPANEAVQKAFEVTRKITDEVAQHAKDIGVQVRRKMTIKPGDELPKGLTSLQRQHLNEGKAITGRFKVPFEQRANYYPHAQVFPDALKGKVQQDIAENLVRQKITPDIESANKFIQDYKVFIASGKRQDSLIKYMVNTGQSKNEAEALSNLQRFRTRTIKRSGSLEFSREVDLPFYDPNTARALPSFIENTSKMLEQIKSFGQDNKVINELILHIRNGGGDADLAVKAKDRILGMINDGATPTAKASRLVRQLQGFKLGLAAIPNSTQGILNSLLYADLRAVGAGVRGLLTASGKEYALKSGATLESVVSEAGKESGALSKFLKATGFSMTEKGNRTIAANAGRSYGQRLFNSLLKNPNKARPARILEELGIDVKKALGEGKLSETDILMMGKRFSDITQFRSRPQDLPYFASTPTGKVFFQFKSFIYGQTRLLHKATIQELKAGNFGRATRNLLVLGTIFPIAGEVTADIRSIITGKKRDSKGLSRYFEDIAQVGTAGILADLLQAGKFQKGTEFLAGPTIGEAGAIIDIAGGPNKLKNTAKYAVRHIPVAGPLASNLLFPKKASSSNSKLPGKVLKKKKLIKKTKK